MILCIMKNTKMMKVSPDVSGAYLFITEETRGWGHGKDG